MPIAAVKITARCQLRVDALTAAILALTISGQTVSALVDIEKRGVLFWRRSQQVRPRSLL